MKSKAFICVSISFGFLIVLCDMNISDIDISYIQNDHTKVIETNVFPYVVAILRKDGYISAGALIGESWVLTAADSLFLIREDLRTIRVRLGSINHKKGGVVLPVKYMDIHPNFDDNKPGYDMALLRLSEKVRLTPSLYPIRMQQRPKQMITTHFIVTAWFVHPTATDPGHIESLDTIKRRRILSVSHLHPLNPERCSNYLKGIDVNETDTLICLDQPAGADPCQREIGAPVVLNGVLWGIVSSWTTDDCDVAPYPSFVNLVSANKTATWIHFTMYGKRKVEEKEKNDYEDNYI